MAKCLYLSEPQFQPKEENSLLEINPVKRPASTRCALATGPGVSFSPSPRCLGHHPLLFCLPLPPAAPHPRPGIFLHQQQVLHGSSCVSLSPVEPSGGGGAGREGKLLPQNQSPLGRALREGAGSIPTHPPAAQTAVVLPSLNSNSPAIVEQARRVPGGAPPPHPPHPDSDGLG